jgi:poly-gamma-glutamate synthesis protein (capsule biosynthesis protein)
MKILEENGIEHAGIWYDDPLETSRISRPVVLQRDDLIVGFLAYTEDVRDHWKASPNRSGPMPIDPDIMEDDIRSASQMVDILIVSIHWRKWPQYTTTPEESDRALCRNSINWGADIIMGHGPHTVHEIEGYDEGVIFYSIGNSAMINGNEKASYSYIPVISIKDRKVNSFDLIPIVLGTYRYIPKGIPLMRTRETGLNVTYDDVWKMYDYDVYDLIDDEKGIREWKILWDETPWYLRSFLIFGSLIILCVIIIIIRTIIKRPKKRDIIPQQSVRNNH